MVYLVAVMVLAIMVNGHHSPTVAVVTVICALCSIR